MAETKQELIDRARNEHGIIVTDPDHTTMGQIRDLIEHTDDRVEHEELAAHEHVEGTSDGSFAKLTADEAKAEPTADEAKAELDAELDAEGARAEEARVDEPPDADLPDGVPDGALPDVASQPSPTIGERGSAATADQATGPQHPASIVAPLPDHLCAGPASVQSFEVRPDELDLPPGSSALQARRPGPGEDG